MAIAEHGSAPLKQSFLPRLASGDLVGANAITEAEAGSDVLAIKTRAERSGDDYVLNGVKSYVTNGPVADVLLVYAVTDPALGYFGLSAFVVEKDAPGLVRGKAFDKIGLRSAPTGAVYLDDCRVPASHRVGDEGQGALIFRGSMAWERACLFAGYLGAMQRDLDRTIAFAKERKQFGRPIGKNQAVAHRIADMNLRLESARLLLYRACWLKDRGEEATAAIALAKLAVSEAAVQSGLDTIRIHASLGTSTETGIADGLLNALPSTIFSGTSEIQRDMIAKGLGL
jgi:alkylation response protein AidB-like acyl-CoA dehydrogenase